MLFRLGRDLGVWDINALGEAMPMSLFREWKAFYDLEHTLLEEHRAQTDVQARTAGWRSGR